MQQKQQQRDPNKPLSVGALETLLVSKGVYSKYTIGEFVINRDKIKILLKNQPHTEKQLLDDPMFAFQIFKLAECRTSEAINNAKTLCNISLPASLPSAFYRKLAEEREQSPLAFRRNEDLYLSSTVQKLLLLKDKGGTDSLKEVYRKLFKNIIEVNRKAGKLDDKGRLPSDNEKWAPFPGGYRKTLERFARAELGFPQDYDFSE